MKELEEAAVDMVVPAQHEVNQERHERRCQQNLVKRADVGGNKIGHRRSLFVNPHFRDDGGLGRGRRLRLRAFAPARRLRLRRRGRLVGSQQAPRLLFGVGNLLLHAFYNLADAFAVPRQVAHQHGQLRVSPGAHHVQKQQRHGAHHEAGQRPRKANARQQHHEGLQDKSDDHRHHRRDEEDAAEIQHRDDHADRHHGHGKLAGIVCGFGRAGSGAGLSDQRHGANRTFCLECSTRARVWHAHASIM